MKYGQRLLDLVKNGISAGVYTQTTDVEGEVNGLITYDRKRAQGKENPYDLYTSDLKSQIALHVNGDAEALRIENGYAVINRSWKKGDKIELDLPMQPRLIKANQQVKDLNGLVALASGPLVYCLESVDNKDLGDMDKLVMDTASPLELVYRGDLLDGINVIKATAKDKGSNVPVTAIPYYAVGNRQQAGYKVWLTGTN